MRIRTAAAASSQGSAGGAGVRVTLSLRMIREEAKHMLLPHKGSEQNRGALGRPMIAGSRLLCRTGVAQLAAPVLRSCAGFGTRARIPRGESTEYFYNCQDLLESSVSSESGASFLTSCAALSSSPSEAARSGCCSSSGASTATVDPPAAAAAAVARSRSSCRT